MDKAQVSKNAQRYLLKGQIDLAIAEWGKLIAEKKDGNVYNIIGDLYLKKNNLKDAVESFKKAADIFREDGFTLKAIALYKKILNITPKDIDTILTLAELNKEKGLTAEAIDNMLLAADIYNAEGKIEKAIEIYQKALELAPYRINLKTKIIELYLKIGLSGEAVRQYVEIAEDYLSKGELEKAKGYFLNAVEIDKQNIPSIIGLSEIAERYGDMDEALVYLKNAISIAPDDSRVCLRYADLLIRNERLDEAEEILKRMAELYPSNTEVKRRLGDIYISKGMLEDAWECLRPVIDEYLAEKRWVDALGILEGFKDMGLIDVRQSLAYAYKGMDKRGEAITVLRVLADDYEREGRGEEAIKAYREILELSPDDEVAREGLERLERRPEVEVIEEGKVEALTPEEFDAKRSEAEFYARYGFKEQAIEIYENLLKSFPENEEIIEKMRLLRGETVPHEAPTETSVSEETTEKVVLQADRDSSLRDIIHEFKKGIEKEVGIDDAETHYNLGIGYKEMGLIDEAISEFMIASKDYRKTRQSMVMIALCHLDKGLYESAINVLNKVKTSMSRSDEGYLDVQYELANAYLKNKDYENALRVFNEIKMEDARFRDVEKKIELVQELIASTKREGVRGKRDRVSYL
ncbi:MAG: tetratricopeptide repeat protein [Thermodesulfovibrionia bacterium]